MNNDDFTVLVSGDSRYHWVSMCTVWPLHSKSLRELSNESASNFVLSLNIPSTNYSDDSESRSCGQLVIGSFITKRAHSCFSSCAEFFGKTSNHPGDSAPLQPRFGTLWLLAFPKTKITFERDEISNHWWDSGKYNRTADGDWENCVRSQGAYIEGDWGITVLCTMFLLSCIFLKMFVFHITWLDTFWTDFIFQYQIEPTGGLTSLFSDWFINLSF